MARNSTPSDMKIAEKLFILNDRGVGLITRLYNIKKACGDSKSKPSFLSEKSLETALKYIVRRFPNIDTRGNSSQLNAVFSIRSDILKSLSLYFFTFVDVLDLKDQVSELLTTCDATQIANLDISLTYDLTKNYLDLVVTYASLMILLSRVDDRRAVLGLFNVAHEMTHGHSDTSFPRLGQLIIDFDSPLKKLSEEFIPHSKLLFQALMSLQYLYPRRNLSVDEWRKSSMLSLIANPGQMLNPAQTETMCCEFLSLDIIERYIVFGFMLIHPYLSQPPASDLFQQVLQTNMVLTIFRDEVLVIHSHIIQYFETIKGYNKRLAEVKECFNFAIANACLIHRERRKFLRFALKELALLLSDQPGLLGPKLLFVLIGLSMSRDEVLWLLRHTDNMPRSNKSARNTAEDLLDRQLPEMLFHIEELRSLVKKYNQVIQLYFLKYLSDYDAVALDHMLQNITVIPEDDSIILSSIVSTISNLNVKQQVEEIFDFRPLRLDWFRLQAYSSSAKYPLNIHENRELTSLLNTISFHTRAVDSIDELLLETSDLSIFCFYSYLFESYFQRAIEFPAQTRYIIAFPLITSHFMNCTSLVCPEERIHIGDRSLTLVSGFLEEMAKEFKDIVTTLCDEHTQIADKLLAKHCAPLIAKVVKEKRDKRKPKSGLAPDPSLPGMESYRKTREELTTLDKLQMALSELAFSIDYVASITVWEHSFSPREYLAQALESRFNKSLVKMTMCNAESNEIAKPSELLQTIRNFMCVLETIENCVHLDITRVFNNSLLQQSQPLDSHGQQTICCLYTNWYLESLLRKVTSGNIIYSRNKRAFITLTAEGQIFSAEEFSDINELRSLAELIGPYGCAFLNQNLTYHISSQINELRKLVVLNKDILIALRSNYDKPEQMKDLLRRLQNVENVLMRLGIIGIILCFKSLCQESLNDVLTERIPYLLSSIHDFKKHVPNGDSMIVSEMASAAGIPCRVDPALVAALRSTKNDLSEDEYTVSCLLMVFIAVSLPKLARNEGSFFRASLEGHSNNIHCLAESINGVASTLFTLCGHGDIEERLKEFLALASSSLLRLGSETDKESVKNRESVYLLLDLIVQESPFLTMDLLESCFPYALLRNAYHAVYRGENM